LTVLRTLADSYFQVGRNYGLLAAKTGATKRWEEARSWHQKSLNIWQDMKSKGSLTDADQKKLDEVSSELKKCDAALKTG
jgi:hypothetical protein